VTRTATELLAWLQQFKDKQQDEWPGNKEGVPGNRQTGAVKVPPRVPPGMWWCDVCGEVIEWAWRPEVTPDCRCSAYILGPGDSRSHCTGILHQAPKLPSARRKVPLGPPVDDGLLDLCPGADCFRRERVAKLPWKASMLGGKGAPHVGDNWHCQRCERTWDNLVPPYRNPTGARCPCCADPLIKPGARKVKGNNAATEGFFTQPTKE
jgi:hypothetical protein